MIRAAGAGTYGKSVISFLEVICERPCLY